VIRYGIRYIAELAIWRCSGQILRKDDRGSRILTRFGRVSRVFVFIIVFSTVALRAKVINEIPQHSVSETSIESFDLPLWACQRFTCLCRFIVKTWYIFRLDHVVKAEFVCSIKIRRRLASLENKDGCQLSGRQHPVLSDFDFTRSYANVSRGSVSRGGHVNAELAKKSMES
jgi:hypothetical protein